MHADMHRCAWCEAHDAKEVFVHSARITGGNWGFLLPLTIFLPL